MAGFADLAAVVAVGHRAVVKPSSKDRPLMEYVIGQLREGKGVDIELVETLNPKELDAVIATGGQEAYRAFGSTYGDIPALLRGSRYSVAVLDGTQGPEELQGLARDLFWYWGLGCRSVVRLFVPQGCDIQALAKRIGATEHEPSRLYDDCYRYARAMAGMEGARWADGGFFVLRRAEFEEFDPPRLAEVLWTAYADPAQVTSWARQHADRLRIRDQ